MTMLASWIAADKHGPTSAYIMSDSRITWVTTKISRHYDHCKKLFASSRYPDMFGYVGDVLFPSVVLSQIVEMIDHGLLFQERMSCEEKSKSILQKINEEMKSYPSDIRGKSIQILHVSRDTHVNYVTTGYPSFFAFLLTLKQDGEFVREIYKLTDVKQSKKLLVLGTGEKDFNERYCHFQCDNNQNTSRNVYQCFIDTLLQSTNYTYGGPPQLVGIYRKPDSCARYYGIIYSNRRFYLGTEIPETVGNLDDVEWRNDCFELCDGTSMRRMPDAMIQPLPKVFRGN